jgi:GntR family transcriptional regulator
VSDDVNPERDGRHVRPVAAHVRIEEHLRRLIAEGHGRTEPLPTEQQLAARFGVSRMTARLAFQRLAGSGMVVRYPSRGSFVAPRVIEDLTEWGRAGFLRRWSEQGFSVGLRILAYETRPASPAVALALNVAEGSTITYLERLRLADGLPVTFDMIYMPAAVHGLIAAEDLARVAVVALLPRHGFPMHESTMEISARPATDAEARPLGITTGDVVIARETLDTAPDGAPVISELSIYPAGRVTYRTRARFVTPETM